MAERGGAHDRAGRDAAEARVEALLAQANQLASASLSKLDRRWPRVPPRWIAVAGAGAAFVIGAVVLTLAGGGPADSVTGIGEPGGTGAAPVAAMAATSVSPASPVPPGSPTSSGTRPEPSPSTAVEATTVTDEVDSFAPSPTTPAAPRTDELRVLDASMLFEVDSHALRVEALAELDQLVTFLVEHPSATLEVVGHTDSAGSEQYNLALSLRRAEAVVEHLVTQGVDPGRLSAFGLGESQPIADNATREGRAANRRIDVVVHDAGQA